jgi:hypothetical protein
MTEAHILDRHNIKIIGLAWPDDNKGTEWANMFISKTRPGPPGHLSDSDLINVKSWIDDAVNYQTQVNHHMEQIKALKLKLYHVSPKLCSEMLELNELSVMHQYKRFGYVRTKITIPTVAEIQSEYNKKHGIDQGESGAE